MLPSALNVLDSGPAATDAERMRAFDQHAALFHRLASAKYDLGWDVPIIGAHDL